MFKFILIIFTLSLSLNCMAALPVQDSVVREVRKRFSAGSTPTPSDIPYTKVWSCMSYSALPNDATRIYKKEGLWLVQNDIEGQITYDVFKAFGTDRGVKPSLFTYNEYGLEAVYRDVYMYSQIIRKQNEDLIIEINTNHHHAVLGPVTKYPHESLANGTYTVWGYIVCH